VVGEADGVGPAGTGAGVGAAAVGDSVGVGTGVSAGPTGLLSGHGRLTGITRGSTPMSRRLMSSIPIRDKKTLIRL
jgi:hypothetical protein